MRMFLQTTVLTLLLALILPNIGYSQKKQAAASISNPKLLIETNYGDIEVELFQDKAPATVANFLRYADEGFYENTLFHRVIRDFMIQAGGFTMDHQKKPTHKPIRNEANNGLLNIAGTLAMARTPDPHSATSQFFINIVDNPRLDFTAETPYEWGYCVFGKVIKGMDIAIEISQTVTGPAGPWDRDAPQGMILIEKISRLPIDQKIMTGTIIAPKKINDTQPSLQSENKKEATP